MEGQAVGKLHYTNCNLLVEPNTQNLKQTIPKILPDLSTALKWQHPSYMNVACLPFAQNFFSLGSYTELAETKSSTPIKYASAFDAEEQRQKMVALGKKAVSMAHRDYLNRRGLID